MGNNITTISWFSAGVSSAVATKLYIGIIDRIIYIDIDDQHSDTMRFVKECEVWFDKPIEILQSPYKDVNTVCRAIRFINGSGGAACTRILKRRVREEWEMENYFFDIFQYIWGFDRDESDRLGEKIKSMPRHKHLAPLIDHNIDKEQAHKILNASGIKRPAMYEMGYHNNNCIGCLKGGMWYWNKIRVDFPLVFESRAKLEREIGHSCLKEKIGNKTVSLFLDELEPNRGRKCDEIMNDCDGFCEAIKL